MRKLLIHPGRTGFVLRARSRDRRAAFGRDVSADELGQRLRSQDRPCRTRIRRSGRISVPSRKGHLSLVDRRKECHPVGVFAAHRTALHPGAQHLHGLRRRSKPTTSPARPISAPTSKMYPGPGGYQGELVAWDRAHANEGVGREGRSSAALQRRARDRAATSCSTGRWMAGSRRSTREPAPNCGSSIPRPASLAIRSRTRARTANSTSRSTPGIGGWMGAVAFPGHVRSTIRTRRSASSAR